jgi:stage II sporulation protein AB (anti-sigma F factor)
MVCGGEMRMQVPPDPRCGRYVREELMGFARCHGVKAVALGDFLTAVGEALANAIAHSQTNQPIEVSAVLLGPDKMIATIADRGVGFTPGESAVEPQLPDGLCERGRGFAIMRHCSDIFSIKSAPGEGTIVTLGRYLRSGLRSRRSLRKQRAQSR